MCASMDIVRVPGQGIQMERLDAVSVALAYFEAKRVVIAAGFGSEIDWQETQSVYEITEHTFLREGAWVILAAGISEQVVRSRFDAISSAFYSWSCAELIAANRDQCREKALRVFGHTGKIEAICRLAEHLTSQGITSVTEQLVEQGPQYLECLEYIGPVTSFHLAKNLGLDVAKEDRHLRRLAASCGYQNAAFMCSEISDMSFDPVRVVDVVLWRFATLQPSNVQLFKDWATVPLSASASCCCAVA